MKYLNIIWITWKKLALGVINFLARILLSIFYFSILLPVGLVSTFMIDRLKIRPDSKVGWSDWKYKADTLEDLHLQE